MKTYGASGSYDITGLDYNSNMIEITKRKLAARNIDATLIQGNVEALPFEDNSFDTVINTMALTGYPDGDKAVSELMRVVKPGGVLLIVDFDYPADRNVAGYWMVKIGEKYGDVMKELAALLRRHNIEFDHRVLGGFGSVHQFICPKPEN